MSADSQPRTWIYARYSTDQQTQKSIDDQLDTSENLSISPGGEGFGGQVRRLVRFRGGLAGRKKGSRRDAGQAGAARPRSHLKRVML